MRGLSTSHRILLYTGQVDFRKRRKSLSQFVEAEICESPFCETYFVFFNRRRDFVRILYWDRNGFAMWEKELEEEKFPLPKKSERKVWVVTQEQLDWLLSGIDVWKMKMHKELSFSTVL